MDDAPRVVQKAHGANSGRVAPEPVPVIEARVVAVAPGPEPTLKEHCVFLKEQLGLEGRIPEVISGACRALGVEAAAGLGVVPRDVVQDALGARGVAAAWVDPRERHVLLKRAPRAEPEATERRARRVALVRAWRPLRNRGGGRA